MTQFVMYKIVLCAHDKILFLNLKTIILTVHCNIEGTNNYVHYVVII